MTSLIHYSTRRSTMANLWHPVKGIQISDLGEKRFLFKFFHIMDLERVLKGSSWTFNNYLLMLYHLRKGEDPPKKRDLNLLSQWNRGSSMEKGQSEMDHDFEDSVMVGPMGKRDLKGRKTNPKWWMSWEFGSPRAVRRLRYMLNLHNPQVVFFMEMKLCSIQMERVRRSYGFFNGIDVQTIGSRGGLCLAWKDDVKIGLRNFSNSHINVDVIEDEIGSQWRLNGFYG
ncbi:hypothetical protein Gotri_005722, partial [Gossypium trilobum]|nr:hypothetical protein [Gossypium trilobum]